MVFILDYFIRQKNIVDIYNIILYNVYSNRMQIKGETKMARTEMIKAMLSNGQGCTFDKTELGSVKAIKEWAKDRGPEKYNLVIFKEDAKSEGSGMMGFEITGNRFKRYR